MKAAPETICGAKTICYAIITEEMDPTGKCRHLVAGQEQGAFAGLAVCEYEDQSAFYLFYCDSDWVPITDGWWESVEDAKRQAEFEYAGISVAWHSLGAV